MGTAHVTTKGTKFYHFVAHRALPEKTPRTRLKNFSKKKGIAFLLDDTPPLDTDFDINEK